MGDMGSLKERLEAHYSLMKKFIRTRSEPTIFYLPIKHTSETERFLEETCVAIEQKIASLSPHLQCSQKLSGHDLDKSTNEVAAPARGLGAVTHGLWGGNGERRSDSGESKVQSVHLVRRKRKLKQEANQGRSDSPEYNFHRESPDISGCAVHSSVKK